jgi:hypothetical protein
MSIRKGDEGLIYIIKTLQARVEKLENHSARTRRNDVRVGDLLISWDSDLNQMTMRNLKTGGVPVTIHVP